MKTYKNQKQKFIEKLCYFLIFSILPLSAHSQITFDKVFGGTNSESSYKVDICNDGGYITAGYTRSSGPGFANMHLIRTSKYGEMLWEFIDGGDMLDHAYSIVATKNGAFVAVGVTTSFGAGQEDIMVVKVDSSGNKLWRKTFGGPQAEVGWDISETSDGGYIVTGSTNNFGAQLFDAFLLKLDKDGNQQWMKTYGGSLFDGGYCVRQTPDGGYAMLGQTLSHGKKGLFYFVKTDSSGNVIWEKTYGGEEEEEGRYFSLTDDGGYILIGKTQSKGAGDEDYYVIKIDENGLVQWDATYGGDKKDSGKSIEPISDGGYIITGSSRSFNWNTPRIWILKIDNNGVKIWEKNFGGWDHDHGHHILPTDDAGFIATGHYNRDIAKAEDSYLLKLDSKGDFNSLAKDAAVLAILRPLSKDCSSPNGKVTVKVKNTGNVVLNSIQLTAKITGSINKNLSQTFNQTLQVFQEYNFTFDETIDTNGGGDIEIVATVILPQDVYEDNNNVQKSININSEPAPTVNLGADINKPGGSPSIELDAGANFDSYKWSTGETTRKIMAGNSQNYWVEVKDKNGCQASDTINILFTSISQANALSSTLHIFPNPADGIFELSFQSQTDAPFGLNIFNYAGQLVYQQQIISSSGSFKEKVNLSGFPKGIYLLNISDGNKMGTIKFILK
jgi:hypothetical protein